MRIPTNWNKYRSNPDSFFSKHFFLNYVIKAYSDILEDIILEEPIEVLEFGCGTGYIDKWICQEYKVKKITLIDFNKKMLKISNKTLSKVKCETELINMDFFDFKPNKQYDIVHSQGVIEHFEREKRYELLKKHCDSTKSNGYCIIYFPSPSRSYRSFRKIAELLGVWKFTDEIPLERKIVVEEMKSLGFTAIKSNVFWKYFLTEEGVIFRRSAPEKTSSKS